MSDRKHGTLVGYARVSTDTQNLDRQLDALAAAGCRRVFKDVGSGSLKHRPELDACLEFLLEGDTLVVWRLDRLGRGLKHLIVLAEDLEQRGIAFRSLSEQLDTSTPGGRLTFHIFGALGEFERDVIRERTRLGVAAARSRNRLGGRPRALGAEKIAKACAMREAGRTMPQIAKTLGVSVATLYRHMPRRPTDKDRGQQAAA